MNTTNNNNPNKNIEELQKNHENKTPEEIAKTNIIEIKKSVQQEIKQLEDAKEEQTKEINGAIKERKVKIKKLDKMLGDIDNLREEDEEDETLEKDKEEIVVKTVIK